MAPTKSTVSQYWLRPWTLLEGVLVKVSSDKDSAVDGKVRLGEAIRVEATSKYSYSKQSETAFALKFTIETQFDGQRCYALDPKRFITNDPATPGGLKNPYLAANMNADVKDPSKRWKKWIDAIRKGIQATIAAAENVSSDQSSDIDVQKTTVPETQEADGYAGDVSNFEQRTNLAEIEDSEGSDSDPSPRKEDSSALVKSASSKASQVSSTPVVQKKDKAQTPLSGQSSSSSQGRPGKPEALQRSSSSVINKEVASEGEAFEPETPATPRLKKQKTAEKPSSARSTKSVTTDESPGKSPSGKQSSVAVVPKKRSKKAAVLEKTAVAVGSLGNFVPSQGERPAKGRRKAAKSTEEPAENDYAVQVINWKERFSVKAKVVVPTAWLKNKLSLRQIPSARPLNPAHVGTLRDSFNKTGTFNTNVCLCFWGMEAPEVNKNLALVNGGEEVNAEMLDLWYSSSLELGAIEGQHSFLALQELSERYPRKPTWQTCSPTIILCSGTPNDIEMVHAIGQQSNFKGTKFLKPEMCDLVRALHTSYMNHYDVTPNEVPTAVITEIKQKWAHYNGVPHHSIGAFWNLAKHTGKLWEQIDLIIGGKVKKGKGRDFKVPKSMHHFNHMGPVPDDVLLGFLTQVTEGRWSLKEFYEQCNRYKVVMQMRRQIIEFMISLGGIDQGSSWETTTKAYPKITPAFMEQWIPTMEAVAKKARFLPEGLKNQLRDMLKGAKAGKGEILKLPNNTQVHLINADALAMARCISARTIGGVIIDQPYGLGQEDWDKAWTEEEYLVLFKQLDAAAKKDNFWVAMYCNHWLLGPTMAAMEKHGFTNVAYMVWWKNNFNIDNAIHLVFATEFIVIGWRAGVRGMPSFLDPNPTKRHNIIIGPQQRHFHTHQGQVINPYQKPQYLAYSICKAWCEPNATVIVVGFGAGGDVEGSVAAGMNVVAFEKDKAQYDAVLGVWRSYMTKFEAKATLDALFPGAKLGKLGSFMHDFQVPAHLSEKVEEIVAGLLAEEEEMNNPGKEVKCSGCDFVLGTEKQDIPRCACGAAICKTCVDLVLKEAGLDEASPDRYCSKQCLPSS